MMSFLNQADSYGEELEGTSSFVNQKSDDDNNSDDNNSDDNSISAELDGPDENIEEQSITELPDLSDPEQNFEENLEDNPKMPPSSGMY